MDTNLLGTKSGNSGGFFLYFYDIKSFFSGKKWEANGLCQVIYLLKKSTFHSMKLLIAVDSKIENDPFILPILKK